MKRTWGWRHRSLAVVVALVIAGSGTAVPGRADEGRTVTDELLDPAVSLPNIAPEVIEVAVRRALTWDPASGGYVEGPPQLIFDVWVQNVGVVPLELVGDEPKFPSTAMQCIAWTGNRVCRETRMVEGYVWDNARGGFVFADFGHYELRTLDAEGRPDYSRAGLLATSGNETFCLIDSALIDLLKPAPPFYLTCGETMHGVSPGWANMREAGTPGQALSLEGLDDGRYVLLVVLDRFSRLSESDDTDNVRQVVVDVSGDLTQATVVDRSYPCLTVRDNGGIKRCKAR